MHPAVPTIKESGVADLDLESWFGLFAPAKTLPEVMDRLRTELAKVIAAPDVAEAFRKAGGRPLSLSEAQTRAMVQGDVKRWTQLVQDTGLKAE
jgi:tripartite-type tricarboxylate transporter receptor subunit TctC